MASLGLPRFRGWRLAPLAAAGLIMTGCGASATPPPSGSAAGQTAATADSQPNKPISQMSVDEIAKVFQANPPEKKYDESHIKKGGTMKVAVTWDSSTLDPTTTASGGAITIANMVYNRLVKFKTGPGTIQTLSKSSPISPSHRRSQRMV